MTRVTAQVSGDGNGYLIVNTADWRTDRGELDEALTGSLREWMARHGHAYPDAGVVTGWARQLTGAPTTGLYGDGECFDIDNTVNYDSLMSVDIGLVVLGTETEGTLAVQVSGDSGRRVAPTVYRSYEPDMVEWAGTTNACGVCDNLHIWYTDDTVTLRSDVTMSSVVRIDAQARKTGGDDLSGYIACPDCGLPLDFDTD